jgi:hypothetical protein
MRCGAVDIGGQHIGFDRLPACGLPGAGMVDRVDHGKRGTNSP